MNKIISTQNSFIKKLIKLKENSRERKKLGLFIVEGKREISMCIKGNYSINTLLVCNDFVSVNMSLELLNSSIKKIEISKEVYRKLAHRNTTEGVIAVVKTKRFSLENIQFKNKNPFILVIESPEKPGNIGALLRTADAANIDAVFIANPKTDLYNPNSIRSSVGCLFTIQIAIGTSKEIISFLKTKNIAIYSATLQNSNPYFKENYTKPSALILGAETDGLTKIWRDHATKNIHIPMQGTIDSMNVSVAGAIIIFEAKRQRNFK